MGLHIVRPIKKKDFFEKQNVIKNKSDRLVKHLYCKIVKC